MTSTLHYKIVPGSTGSFLCPPGHPNHTQSLEGYESPRHRTVISGGALDSALADDFDGSDYIKDRVREIMDAATLVESELWVRSVYGYFRSMYVPESGSRNVSDLISYSPAEIAEGVARKVLAEAFERYQGMDRTPGGKDALNFRRGVTLVTGRRRGYEITAKPDGSRVYVYALADDGTRYSADHLDTYADALHDTFDNVEIKTHPTDTALDRVEADMVIAPEPMDPERHAAVAFIRTYFPDHTPRLDLILDPGKGYGLYLCTKCGERVRYEAKFDKMTKGDTQVDGAGVKHWTYENGCPQGGDHTV